MKYVLANLKMNVLTRTAADAYCAELIAARNRARLSGEAELVVCPSAPHLDVFAARAGQHPWLKVGAQDVSGADRGSFTGQIAARTLRDGGCLYTLVGHSETRREHTLSDEQVAEKVAAALRAGLRPAVFIGETAEQRRAGQIKDVLTAQTEAVLRGVPEHNLRRLLLVYEPVWAIGASAPPETDQIISAKIMLRKILIEICGDFAGREISLLYGGSVTDRNAAAVVSEAELDGVVIGRAALDPAALVRIAASLEKIS